MENKTTFSWFDRTLAVCILTTILFMVLETYILPRRTVIEVFDRYTQSSSRDKRGERYITKELLTYQGGRYQMTTGTIPIQYEDTIFVDKSPITGSALSITYPYQGQFYKKKIGVINNNWMVPILLLLAFLYSAGILSGQIRRLHDVSTAHHLQLLVLVFVIVVSYQYYIVY